MGVGNAVVIVNTDSIWDGKEGTLQSIDERNGTCVVYVNFEPGEDKYVLQEFAIDNVQSI